MLVRNCVPVLLEEALDLVRDVERVVRNRECRVTKSRLLEHLRVLRLAELVVQFLQEGLVGTGGETGLFVQESHDTELALDDVDAGLVVGEFDERPVDLLPHVLLLLELEHVLVELRVRSEYAPNEWTDDSTSCCSFSLA